MSGLTEFIANPLLWKVLGGYWLFSAAASALEAPSDKSGAFYRFVYRFIHGLAGNMDRAAQTFKVPGA